MGYRRAVDVLEDLPAVFTSADACRVLGSKRVQTRTYLARWRRAGHVESLGTTGIHFNLVVDPAGRDARIGEALMRLSPAAVLVGASALFRHGWLSDPPTALDVALPRRKDYPDVPGVALHPRSAKWFEIVLGHTEIGESRMPELAPGYALVDILAQEGLSMPPLGHVDIPDEEIDVLLEAADAFGVERFLVERHIERYIPGDAPRP